MLMIVLTPETERLVRRIAEQRGRAPEDVLKESVEKEARIAGIAPGETGEPRRTIDLARVRAIIRDVSTAPLRDGRSPDEILSEAWGGRL